MPNSITFLTIGQSYADGRIYVNTTGASSGTTYTIPVEGASVTVDCSSYVGTSDMYLVLWKKSGYSCTVQVTAWTK